MFVFRPIPYGITPNATFIILLNLHAAITPLKYLTLFVEYLIYGKLH